MKNFFIFFLLLSLRAWTTNSAAQDSQSNSLKPEVAGPFLVAGETGGQVPTEEQVKLMFIIASCSHSSLTNAVAQLAQSGIPANSTNSAGMTALMWLARGSRYSYDTMVESANRLIRYGTNPESNDKNGKTSADYAFKYGYYNLLPVLDVSGKYKPFYEGGAKRGAQDQLGQTVGDLVIESMSRGGNLPPEPDKVKIISDALKAGANPDQDILILALGGASSEDYWMPLGQIMPEAISELVRFGARVNEPLSNGLQPLFYAVSKPVLFKMLLNAGADPSKPSYVGWTDFSDYKNGIIKLKYIKEPIICEAAQFGVPETLQMLLDRGVSIEERDSRGNTPLLCAVNFANVDTINFLLKHHASLQATNNEGQNALDLAAARMNVDFVRTYDKKGQYQKILEDYPGDPKSPVVGKWALESDTNLFLRIDRRGGGEVIHSFHYKKPLAWKAGEKATEITVYSPQIPRFPGGQLEPGWVEYHPETDTCILSWQFGPQPSTVKLVRMK